MVSSKICTKVKSLLDREICKVLVSKRNHFTLCNKKRKLIFPSIAELAQLDAGHLRSGGRSKMLKLGAFNKDVLEVRVCILAMFGVNKRFPRRVFLVMVPYW